MVDAQAHAPPKERDTGVPEPPRGRRLELLRLEAQDFRNLSDCRLDLAPTVNVFSGANGHGKTSLLEAVYCVATTKSFRTTKLRELRQHGKPGFRLSARLHRTGDAEDPIAYQQTILFLDRTTTVRIDEHRPASLAEYARRSPVVVFHPEELQLSTGPASLRRRLLDRIALYQSPAAFEALSRYRHAQQRRLELLRRQAAPSEVDAYEAIAADAACRLSRYRRVAAETLFPHVLSSFARIADPKLQLGLDYRSGGSEDQETCRREFFDRRDRDARAASATFGPQRDDVRITIDGHDVRQVASQGQHRAIALAIKAAEGRTIRDAVDSEPLFLLDDISSELDRERTAALLSFLSEMRGQLLLTTTRPDLIKDALNAQETTHFQLVAGTIQAAGRS